MATIERAARYLGIAIANVVNVLAPDRVVIGGGIAAAGDQVMIPLRAAVERRIPFVPAGALDLRLAELGRRGRRGRRSRRPTVVLAELGSMAGGIGAALAGAEAATAGPQAGPGSTTGG